MLATWIRYGDPDPENVVNISPWNVGCGGYMEMSAWHWGQGPRGQGVPSGRGAGSGKV